jgi:2-haloacid dehalogenase
LIEIKHLVFDIGKVLIRYDLEIPYRRLIPDEKERVWFLDTVCTPAWNAEQDRGRTWPEAEAALIAIYPDRAEHIRAFRKYWHEMIPGSIDGSVEILQACLERGMDVTLLTNFAADTFYETCERFPFLRSTRGVTVSAEIGLIKPDAEIFAHHCETFSLQPSATLLIDDDANNVNSAIDAGWQAVLFTDAVALETELDRLGL